MNQPLAYINPGSKIATKVVVEPFTTINNNVTSLYDEGNFFVNWTSGGGGEAEGNYTVHLWKDDQYVNATENANNSVTGYTFGTSVEANYTFTIASVNATNNDTNSTTNISMYVDTTVPAVSSPVRPVVNGNYSDSIVLNVSYSLSIL